MRPSSLRSSQVMYRSSSPLMPRGRASMQSAGPWNRRPGVASRCGQSRIGPARSSTAVRFRKRSPTARKSRPPASNPAALAYILFTSGTTAEPSGVEITVANLVAHLETIQRLFSFGLRRVFSTLFPSRIRTALCWDRCWLWLPEEASSGRDHSMWEMSKPGSAASAARRHTHGYQSDRAEPGRAAGRAERLFRRDGFKGIVSSASQLSREHWERFEQRFGTELWNLYGLTRR